MLKWKKPEDNNNTIERAEPSRTNTIGKLELTIQPRNNNSTTMDMHKNEKRVYKLVLTGGKQSLNFFLSHSISVSDWIQ